jgi:DNA repair exonuclease SbcCD ATPase subunit
MAEAFPIWRRQPLYPGLPLTQTSQYRSGYEEVRDMEKCSVCGEEFETEEALLKHTGEVHSEVVEDTEQPQESESRTGNS